MTDHLKLLPLFIINNFIFFYLFIFKSYDACFKFQSKHKKAYLDGHLRPAKFDPKMN